MNLSHDFASGSDITVSKIDKPLVVNRSHVMTSIITLHNTCQNLDLSMPKM